MYGAVEATVVLRAQQSERIGVIFETYNRVVNMAIQASLKFLFTHFQTPRYFH